MSRAIVLLFLLLSCKGSLHKNNPPPPTVEGKCLADRYDGDRAASSTCVYQGYTWNCYDSDVTGNWCTRKGEATAERKPVAEPAK